MNKLSPQIKFYDTWGLSSTPTLSPAQYGPDGDETHGQPLDMHLPNASSLLFGSYAPPPENEPLSPFTILRHDIYESALGNVFSSVDLTGSTLSLFLPSTFRFLRPHRPFRCRPFAPASQAALSDSLRSTSPPGRLACSKRVLK